MTSPKEATVNKFDYLPSKTAVHLDQLRRRQMLCFFRLFKKKKNRRHDTPNVQRPNNAAPVSDMITDGTNIPSSPPDNELILSSVDDEINLSPPLDNNTDVVTPAQKFAADLLLAEISAWRKERKESYAKRREIIEMVRKNRIMEIENRFMEIENDKLYAADDESWNNILNKWYVRC